MRLPSNLLIVASIVIISLNDYSYWAIEVSFYTMLQ